MDGAGIQQPRSRGRPRKIRVARQQETNSNEAGLNGRVQMPLAPTIMGLPSLPRPCVVQCRGCMYIIADSSSQLLDRLPMLVYNSVSHRLTPQSSNGSDSLHLQCSCGALIGHLEKDQGLYVVNDQAVLIYELGKTDASIPNGPMGLGLLRSAPFIQIPGPAWSLPNDGASTTDVRIAKIESVVLDLYNRLEALENH